MNVTELLTHLHRANASVQVVDGAVRVRAPKGALDPVLRAALVEHKQDLLRLLDATRPSVEPTPAPGRISGDGEHSPSPGQAQLLLLDRLEPGTPLYTVLFGLTIRGRLDVVALRRSLDEIARRHEILRTTFRESDGRWRAVVGPATPVPLELVDGRATPPSERADAMQALARRLGSQPFDLAHGPLIRCALLVLGDDEHALVVSQHHSVTDGWSIYLLGQELAVLYGAFARGEASPLPPLALQYADYARWYEAWLSGEGARGEAEYWKERLADLPDLELPADRSVALVSRTHAGAQVRFQIPRPLEERVARLCERHGLTLCEVLLGTWVILLHRYSGQMDLGVGLTSANRARREWRDLLGFFSNTLVVRSDLSGEPTALEALRRVSAQVTGALEHGTLPFSEIVRAARHAGDEGLSPLVQACFVLENFPGVEPAGAGPELAHWVMTPDGGLEGVAKFDLILAMGSMSGTLEGSFLYSTDLFERATIERMAQHFERILAAVVEEPNVRLARLELLSSEEKEALLAGWGNAAKLVPVEKRIEQLFEEQVRGTPGGLAVVYQDERLTYAELNARANRLAHALRGLGVTRGEPVGLCVGRSVEMLVGMLGILKAGGAYLPLDPAQPLSRLSFILEDSKARFLLTQDALSGQLAGTGVRLFSLDDERPLAAQPSSTPEPCASADDLVYVIYTSGSSGPPKGVMLTHANVVPLLTWGHELLRLTSSDRVLQALSYFFDWSAWEIFLTLTSGATLVVPTDEVARSPEDCALLIERHGITVVHGTPTQFSPLLEHAERLSTLRHACVGAEALPFALAAACDERLPPSCRLYNMYGPTETAIIATTLELARGDVDRFKSYSVVPIGGPTAQTGCLVLDGYGNLCPAGVTGELCIRGPGVSRGYVNRPELTAQKFVLDPFSAAPGARMYMSGDRARLLPDGNIEYRGRGDQQVKLRGYRIELGEIEWALARHPRVRACAVVVREDVPGRKQLVAYVVLRDGEPLDREGLREHLSAALPEYMVPAAFVALDTLPMTPNGKLSSKLLPPPEPGSVHEQEYVAPRTPAESAVAGIFADLLGLERVGATENFFHLGGHSLLATRVVSRLRSGFGVEMDLRTIFQHPTVEALARELQLAERAGSPPLEPVPRDEALPLSFSQQRLWFIQQLVPASGVFNIPAVVKLSGHLAVEPLRGALEGVIHRHEALRTTFSDAGGQPVQVVKPPAPLILALEDLSPQAEADREATLQDRISEEAQTPFDLRQGPLIRLRLLRTSSEAHYLLITLHHIISDAWSMEVLLRELAELYSARCEGREERLPTLRVQYPDYAVWERRNLAAGALEKDLDYWKTQLSALSPLELPADFARPTVQSHRGACVRTRIPQEVVRKLKGVADSRGATVFMAVVGALGIVLERHSGQRDICIGSPSANRTRAETDGLIGFFINTLALRVSLAGNPSFLELLERVRETCLGAFAHQQVPFDRVVQELAPGRDLGRSPIFQVALAEGTSAQRTLQAHGLKLEVVESEIVSAQYDLTLFLQAGANGLDIILDYCVDLFERATIERMAGHLGQVLEAVASAPGAPISSVALLTPAERQRILFDWNRTGVDYPADVCLHTLVERQVERTPTAIALLSEGQQLTYAELNARANQLARRLRDLGATADMRVGVCMERSVDMVVGLLGILKAGAAYLPLEPSYPRERLQFMMQDADVSLVLTHAAAAGAVAESRRTVVTVDSRCALPACEQQNIQVPGLSSASLAYVIYTSGSTGQPKGVMISHRAICNRLLWMQDAYGLDASDRVLQKTPFSFDVSVWEFFWPFLTGASLVVAKPGGHRDSAYLVRALQEWQVTTLHFVPSMLRMFLAAEGVGRCTSLRRIFSSGEALPFEVQEAVFRELDVELHNLYGPTEAAVDVTAWQCQPGSSRKLVPIGRPIANIKTYILDEDYNPTPVGVPGELYLGGVGLARGYVNRPGLTAERFIADPFGAGPEARLYRTGDLARYLPDGAIDFLGRKDRQLKLRGFRIEPAEIESALAEHSGVAETIVAVTGPQETARLCAYVVPSRERARGVRRWLRLEREGRLRNRRQQDLPNGVRIVHLNPGETEFMYKEVFEERAYLKHGISIEPGDCVFDVGANVGLFSLFAARHARDVTVYAFEPLPGVFELLSLNAELHELRGHCFNCALGAETGRAAFTYYPHVSILSGQFSNEEGNRQIVRSLLSGEDEAAAAPEMLEELLTDRLAREQVVCEVRTLSSVMRAHGVSRIDLLKIDVEGAELDVLAGIEDDDWRRIGQVVLEVHGGEAGAREVTRILERQGYTVSAEEEGALRGAGLFNLYARRPEAGARGTAGDRAMPAEWSSPRRLLDDVRQFARTRVPEHMVPSTFHLLEEIPLSSNGKVDHGALRQVAGSADTEDAESRRPMSSTEEIVAGIYSELLGKERISPTDNFFDLGGHSLLTLALIARLRESFGVELELWQLFESQTVESLASRIERRGDVDPQSRLPPLVVLLRAAHAGPPLFLLHGGTGSVLCYAEMVRRLRFDGPVYGVRAPETWSGGGVEELATEYLRAVRAVQPRGPYRIGGYSVGGVIAFEMARQLLDSQAELGGLFLLDAVAPGQRAAYGDELSALLSFVRALEQSHGVDLLPFILAREGLPSETKADDLIGLLRGRTQEERLQLVKDAFTAAAARRGLDGSPLEGAWRVFGGLVGAVERYVPRGGCRAPAVLFRAEKGARANVDDPTLGWDALLERGLRVVDVPGDHFTMITQPSVAALAEALGGVLGL